MHHGLGVIGKDNAKVEQRREMHKPVVLWAKLNCLHQEQEGGVVPVVDSHVRDGQQLVKRQLARSNASQLKLRAERSNIWRACPLPLVPWRGSSSECGTTTTNTTNTNTLALRGTSAARPRGCVGRG